jgi:septal ring factor EnvC (AmiA/AmiB activator)
MSGNLQHKLRPGFNFKGKLLLLNKFILRALLVFSILLLFNPSITEAADALDKLSEIRSKIQSRLQKVKEAKIKETSIQSKIKDLNKNINKKESQLNNYNKLMAQTKPKIRAITTEINRLTGNLDRRQHLLNERIKAIHKRQRGGNALMLTSAADYQDLMVKSKYMSLLAHYEKRVIKDYSKDLSEINVKKQELENLNRKLSDSRKNTMKKKEEMRSERIKKGKLLAIVKKKRSEQEKKINELKTSSNELLSMVSRFKKRSIPQSITGKGFRASKGKLPWPADGSVVIPYGNYKDPDLQATVFKNGIEIKLTPGINPKAVAGGRVVYANTFKGYGNLLIIDHGNGFHSLYGNLEEISFKSGELLIGGMDVGKAGISKTLKYPALYFEIRYKGKPQEPTQWFMGNI